MNSDQTDLARTDLISSLLDQAERTETNFAAAGGPGQLVWHRWGGGLPIVLLHGGAGSWRHWARNIPALLQRGYHVFAPDLPGLGGSSRPQSPYDPGTVAAIVAAGLRSLLAPGQQVDLVGFSFGSIVSGQLTARFPELVRSLTLVGAGALGVKRPPLILESVRDKTGVERTAANRTNLLRLMIRQPEKIDELALAIQDWNVSHARVNSVGFASSTVLLDALRRVTCPLGAIWGEHDQAAAPLLDQRIAALHTVRPDLPLEIIPDAGHWVAFEAAPLFDAALERVLAHHRSRVR